MKNATRERSDWNIIAHIAFLEKGFFQLSFERFPWIWMVVWRCARNIETNIVNPHFQEERTNKKKVNIFKKRILTNNSSQDPGGRGVAPRRPSVEKVFSYCCICCNHSRKFFLIFAFVYSHNFHFHKITNSRYHQYLSEVNKPLISGARFDK